MSPSSSIPPTQCKCRLPLMTLTSWTCSNPARRFGVFRNKYKTGIKQCKRWHWFDPELENEWANATTHGRIEEKLKECFLLEVNCDSLCGSGLVYVCMN
ncbi:hypothetical protein Tco_1558553 [Tanacetum coccineum]